MLNRSWSSCLGLCGLLVLLPSCDGSDEPGVEPHGTGNFAGGGAESSTGGAGSGGSPDGAGACQPAVETAGFIDCKAGYRHRAAQAACENTTRSHTIARGDCDIEGECCQSDFDCAAGSACWEAGIDSHGDFYGTCFQRCESDEECGAQQICECTNGAGRCVTASCSTDDDCGVSAYCVRSAVDEGCGPQVEYSCQSPQDECTGDTDCQAGSPDFEVCASNGAHRECLPQYQACDS